MQLRLSARRLVAIAALLLAFPAGAADDARARAERLATQAEKVLDSWSGEHEKLLEAQRLIDEAMSLDPRSGHAMVERGRAMIMANYGVSGEAGQAAAALFHRATRLDPPYGRAFVLQGYVFTEQRRFAEAKGALTQAEALVPDDPWVKLNWGSYYVALSGQRDKQLQYAEEVMASGTQNPKALVTAHEIVIEALFSRRDRIKAEGLYARAARAQPGNAWLRGNHARNVITYFADFEAGETLAREALAIMDYGHARQTLSLALYGRWALAVRQGKALDVREPLYAAAYRNDPGAANLPECAMRTPSLAFVFEAIAAKGVQRRDMHRC